MKKMNNFAGQLRAELKNEEKNEKFRTLSLSLHGLLSRTSLQKIPT
jgi:hypothetical protein